MATAESQRRRRAGKLERGECLDCPAPVAERKSRCQKCLDQKAQTQKRLRADRIKVGKCVRCPKKARRNKTMCVACIKVETKRTNRYTLLQRDNWRRAGLCSRCGFRKPEWGYATCRVCLKVGSVQYAARREVEEYERNPEKFTIL